MLPKFPQERATTRPAMDCQACCFFRLVELESRKLRLLCMLTGEKRPIAGMDGCNFIPGQWVQIDRILGLQSLDFSGNTGDPDNMKPGKGFSSNGRKIARKNTFSIDDFFGKPINHIQRKRKGSLARPGFREDPVAHVARERA